MDFTFNNRDYIGYVVRCQSSMLVWQALEKLFYTESKTQPMHLKYQLQTTRKGSLSISNYFLKMKEISLLLLLELKLWNLICYFIFQMVWVLSIMQLWLTLLPRLDTFLLKKHNFSFRVMSFDLLNIIPYKVFILNIVQTWLEGLINLIKDLNSLSHQIIFKASKGRRRSNRSYGPTMTNSVDSRMNIGPRVNNVAGHGNNRPICQLYRKTRHVALKCYHRFDISFQGDQDSAGATQFNISQHQNHHQISS